MAKSVHNDVLDGALNVIKNNCTHQTVCSAEPTTFATAFSTALAVTTMATGTDYTVGDGDTNGRKVAVAQKAAIPVTATQSANHVALCTSAGASALYYVTTCTLQGLTSGNTVTIPTWDIEIADPT